ncbi:MAG: alpha-galactosidase [Hungatella sp.]|jgi:alpha-galactosidase|nr:alpha-galactosidase [Hungatella sp.]
MGYISFHEETKVFTLHTRTTMYQMQVGRYGTLLHLYYGADLGDAQVIHSIVNLDRGFSGNPYEADRDRKFSLDVLPQEYTAEGNGDYRIQGIEAEHEDGSHVLQLKYDSHEIKKGKYVLAGMPAMFAGEDEGETLEIMLRDELSGLCVKLLYGVLWDCDIITRTVEVVNRGEKSITLRRVMSAELDFPKRPMDMIHFYGRHSMERLTERQPLHHGIQSVESKRGISSHHHNPTVIFCDHTATEDYGECFGVAFVYSGNFICQAELDQVDQTRVVMGIHPYQFAWTLKPGEVFTAPEAAMSYSGAGLEALSHHFHDGFREHLIRSSYVKKPRPILVNNWEATYFEFNEEKLYGIAKAARDVGLEMFVLDDGWFGKRDSDYTGLGDWYVNEEKIHGGLPKLVGKIRKLGLKFGIWLEPEMVSEDSDLYRRHPDWCLRVPGRLPVRSRSQLNLDVTKKEVRDYIMEQIFKVIDSCQADYIKWDVNRALGNVYSQGVEAGRQGEIFHRHMLGVYDMMERLISRYPNLLFETCAGGGGRFDAGMLYYSPQIWCSDNTDAADRLEIHYGTSFFYPISTFGAHVSVCPNHQTGRTTSLRTRGIVAGSGTFGYELDLEHMDQEEKDAAKVQIAQFKDAEELVQQGDYYRLSAPGDRSNSVFWEFVSKDKRDVLVAGVVLRSEVNPPVNLLRFRGLLPDLIYREKESKDRFSGAVLMKAGLALPVTSEDYESVVYRFEAVE